jgi:hypothetical protein
MRRLITSLVMLGLIFFSRLTNNNRLSNFMTSSSSNGDLSSFCITPDNPKYCGLEFYELTPQPNLKKFQEFLDLNNPNITNYFGYEYLVISYIDIQGSLQIVHNLYNRDLIMADQIIVRAFNYPSGNEISLESMSIVKYSNSILIPHQTNNIEPISISLDGEAENLVNIEGKILTLIQFQELSYDDDNDIFIDNNLIYLSVYDYDLEIMNLYKIDQRLSEEYQKFKLEYIANEVIVVFDPNPNVDPGQDGEIYFLDLGPSSAELVPVFTIPYLEVKGPEGINTENITQPPLAHPYFQNKSLSFSLLINQEYYYYFSYDELNSPSLTRVYLLGNNVLSDDTLSLNVFNNFLFERYDGGVEPGLVFFYESSLENEGINFNPKLTLDNQSYYWQENDFTIFFLDFDYQNFKIINIRSDFYFDVLTIDNNKVVSFSNRYDPIKYSLYNERGSRLDIYENYVNSEVSSFDIYSDYLEQLFTLVLENQSFSSFEILDIAYQSDNLKVLLRQPIDSNLFLFSVPIIELTINNGLIIIDQSNLVYSMAESDLVSIYQSYEQLEIGESSYFANWTNNEIAIIRAKIFDNYLVLIDTSLAEVDILSITKVKYDTFDFNNPNYPLISQSYFYDNSYLFSFYDPDFDENIDVTSINTNTFSLIDLGDYLVVTVNMVSELGPGFYRFDLNNLDNPPLNDAPVIPISEFIFYPYFEKIDINGNQFSVDYLFATLKYTYYLDLNSLNIVVLENESNNFVFVPMPFNALEQIVNFNYSSFYNDFSAYFPYQYIGISLDEYENIFIIDNINNIHILYNDELRNNVEFDQIFVNNTVLNEDSSLNFDNLDAISLGITTLFKRINLDIAYLGDYFANFYDQFPLNVGLNSYFFNLYPLNQAVSRVIQLDISKIIIPIIPPNSNLFPPIELPGPDPSYQPPFNSSSAISSPIVSSTVSSSMSSISNSGSSSIYSIINSSNASSSSGTNILDTNQNEQNSIFGFLLMFMMSLAVTFGLFLIIIVLKNKAKSKKLKDDEYKNDSN